MAERKVTKLRIFRDVVRVLFIGSFFVLEDLTEAFLGFEFEFESEFVVLACILLFGTFWCGWFCPFGNVQYFASMIGRKLLPKLQLTIPENYDRPLRYLKFGFLAMFIAVFVTTGIGYFDDHEQMYESTWYSNTYAIFKKPWAIALIPLFIPRFFCKYLCYQKAIYQVINKVFPLMRIARNPDSCVDCSKCSRQCPMDIDIGKASTISGGECVGCLACVDEHTCPSQPPSLQLKWFGIKVRPMTLSIVVTILYVAATAAVLYFIGVEGAADST